MPDRQATRPSATGGVRSATGKLRPGRGETPPPVRSSSGRAGPRRSPSAQRPPASGRPRSHAGGRRHATIGQRCDRRRTGDDPADQLQPGLPSPGKPSAGVTFGCQRPTRARQHHGRWWQAHGVVHPPCGSPDPRTCSGYDPSGSLQSEGVLRTPARKRTTSATEPEPIAIRELKLVVAEPGARHPRA
jgi:hypothetical protein